MDNKWYKNIITNRIDGLVDVSFKIRYSLSSFLHSTGGDG
jgi:hypothetical protein